MVPYNIKSTEGQFVQKYREIFFLMYYIYIQSTTKRKQQRSAEKDTTSKLKHSKPLALKKRKEKKTVFFHSLYKHTNHTANFVQYTHRG